MSVDVAGAGVDAAGDTVVGLVTGAAVVDERLETAEVADGDAAHPATRRAVDAAASRGTVMRPVWDRRGTSRLCTVDL